MFFQEILNTSQSTKAWKLADVFSIPKMKSYILSMDFDQSPRCLVYMRPKFKTPKSFQVFHSMAALVQHNQTPFRHFELVDIQTP